MTTTNTTISLSSLCDAQVAEHSLLSHPFYAAWSNGTLPVDALRDYAREYGAFIATIARGWKSANEPAIARTEEYHADVWNRTFAAGLQTSVGMPKVKAVAELMTGMREMFDDRVTALGALYAFEAQQPLTAASKLKGLQDHYRQLPAGVGEYFRLHDTDDGEPALLARSLNALSPADQARALAACDRACRLLYNALTGVHAPYATSCMH